MFFTFNEIQYEWKSWDYLTINNSKQICFLFEKAEKTVLGASFMWNKFIMFDIENEMIGFKDYLCESRIDSQFHLKKLLTDLWNLS